MICRSIILASLAISVIVPSASRAQRAGSADSTASIRRLTGKTLDRSVAVRWENVPLRRVLYELGKQQHLAVLLDRRIDPDRPVSLQVTAPQPIGLVLHRIAARSSAVIVPIESLIYVAPEGAGWQIGEQFERLRREWLRSANTAMRRRMEFSWRTPGCPRDLLVERCRRYGVTLREVDRVPHDLWMGNDLGELTFPASATALLAGFEMDASWDAAHRELAVRRRTDTPRRGTGYFYASSNVDRSELERRFAADRLHWRRRGMWWVVTGPHVGLARAARYFGQLETGSAPRDLSRSRLTFAVRQQPLGAVLKTLEQQLRLEFELSPQAREQLDRRVSFKVERATLDETLRAALRRAGLAFERRGRRITVTVETDSQ